MKSQSLWQHQTVLLLRWLRANLSYTDAPRAVQAKFHCLIRKGIVPFLVAFIAAQLVVMLVYVVVNAMNERSNIPILLNTVTLGFHGVELSLLLVFCRRERGRWQRHALDGIFCGLFLLEMALLGLTRADMQHYLHYKIKGLPAVYWQFAQECENDGDTDGEHHENICLLRSSHATHSLAQFWMMYFILFVLPHGRGLLVVSISSFAVYTATAVLGLEDLHLTPTDSQGIMFLHADLVWMGTTMLVILMAKAMIHRSRLDAFMESESQRGEIISERVMRFEAEFKNESVKPQNRRADTTSEVETDSVATSNKRKAPSIASAPARLMQGEYSLTDFVENALFKECVGDCLPCDALVWVEDEVCPVLLSNLAAGQKVLCYDTLSHTPKYVPILKVAESTTDNTDQWVTVTLEDGTVLEMTNDHPVPRFDMLSQSAIGFVKAGSLKPKSDKVMTWKMATTQVQSVMPGASADAPTKWMQVDVQQPGRYMYMVSRGDALKHTPSMLVGSSSLSASQTDEEDSICSAPPRMETGPRFAGRHFSGAASPFWKTRMCNFYAAGHCQRGRRCLFAHGKEELRMAPDMARTSLCPTVRAREECRDPSCRYAHSLGEVRKNPMLARQLCTYHMQGHCLAGDECNFAHSMEDVEEALALGGASSSAGPDGSTVDI